jgi:beta-N-acetylhexosaminidase
MLDLEGRELTKADQKRLRHPNTGGVILFTRNFSEREQLGELVASIRRVRPELLVAVDHEGGRVQRFRDRGFTSLPAMRRIGQLWDADPRFGPLEATRMATAVGYVLGHELLSVGIDLSFTPVLDLDYGRSEVIGDRALHSDPRTVTLLAKSLCHGLVLAGMGNCGKHFPGHGYVSADSHLALPVDRRPLEEILAADAAPYEWLDGVLSAVMPAHITYPMVDALPAGFSRRWLVEILRGQLGFSGAIFSDDLGMAGARVTEGVVGAARRALAAGCDMVLLCNAPELADELLAAGQLSGTLTSAGRIDRLKRAALWASNRDEPDAVYRSSLERIAALDAGMPIPLGKGP